MPQAACLTPLPLLSPLDCTVFCSKQFFTVWAAQVNLPAWLGRGDAAHSMAALSRAHLRQRCCLSTGFVPRQGMEEGAQQRMGQLGMGKGLGEHGVMEHLWPADLVSAGSSSVGCSEKGSRPGLKTISFSICYNLLKNSGFPQNGP